MASGVSPAPILTTAAPSLPTPHPYPDAHLPGPSGPSPPPERDQPAVPVNQPLASPLPASAEALEAAECSRCAKSQQRVADLEAELQSPWLGRLLKYIPVPESSSVISIILTIILISNLNLYIEPKYALF